MPETVRVHIGEIACVNQGVLQAVLGSCVGIALWHKRGQLTGMAHCLLPEAPPEGGGAGARYVDSGVANLLEKLGWEREGTEPPRGWRGVIAGGNHVFEKCGSKQLEVGAMNLETARRVLRDLRIPFEEVTQPAAAGCLLEVDSATRNVRAESLSLDIKASSSSNKSPLKELARCK
jgi:chemotaxis protein CheD